MTDAFINQKQLNDRLAQIKELEQQDKKRFGTAARSDPESAQAAEKVERAIQIRSIQILTASGDGAGGSGGVEVPLDALQAQFEQLRDNPPDLPEGVDSYVGYDCPRCDSNHEWLDHATEEVYYCGRRQWNVDNSEEGYYLSVHRAIEEHLPQQKVVWISECGDMVDDGNPHPFPKWIYFCEACEAEYATVKEAEECCVSEDEEE